MRHIKKYWKHKARMDLGRIKRIIDDNFGKWPGLKKHS